MYSFIWHVVWYCVMVHLDFGFCTLPNPGSAGCATDSLYNGATLWPVCGITQCSAWFNSAQLRFFFFFFLKKMKLLFKRMMGKCMKYVFQRLRTECVLIPAHCNLMCLNV